MSLVVGQKAIILNKESKFLVLFRTETAPFDPKTWDIPGGKLEMGEDLEDAIKREVTEETGLVTKELTLAAATSSFSPKGDFQVRLVYVVSVVDERVNLSFEHSDYRWVNKDECMALDMPERLKQLIQKVRI